MRAFLDELKKGFPGPLYLAYCADPYLLYEAKLMVKKTVPAPAAEFALESFDAADDRFSVEAAVEALRSVPFLGGRKVVIIENLDELRAEGTRKILSYAGNPEAQSLLFMLMNAKKLPQNFTDPGMKLKLLPLSISPRDLPVWIRKKASDEGFSLSAEVVSYLEGNYPAEPGMIASELKKLALIGKPVVEMEDVRSLMRDMSAHNAFDLVRALGAKDAGRVFSLAREFRAQHELVMLLGALNREFSRPGLPPGVFEKAIPLLREADMKVKALSGAYPIEDLLVRLLRI
ncbi:MAG: DNA polymerase III subunit delta [Nitrospiraceae bacterium]|nr:DNA polymerase III subunit delta [Nitrospiraceae bacterium]